MNYHQPVLLAETLAVLKPDSTKTFIDATLGNGGHTIELLKSGAKIYGFDFDENNLKITKERINSLLLEKNFIAINDNFINISKHINTKVNGILFDLGLSSNQQKSENRGFSFNDEFSLDMRLNPNTQALTAENIINTYSEQELFDIFSKLAQEKKSSYIAHKIVINRQKKPIKTAKELSDIISQVYTTKTKINPATKIFLALKIVVNDEINNLKSALTQSVNLIKPGDPICVITFHSTEDRVVKQFINNNNLIDLGVYKPKYQEIKQNPLSRSAILRSFTIINA